MDRIILQSFQIQVLNAKKTPDIARAHLGIDSN